MSSVRDIRTDVYELAQKLGSKETKERLQAAGLSKSTSEKLVYGTYKSVPKGLTAKAIARVLEGPSKQAS